MDLGAERGGGGVWGRWCRWMASLDRQLSLGVLRFGDGGGRPWEAPRSLGWPVGIVELFGEAGMGKSRLAWQIAQEQAAAGAQVCYLDVYGALDGIAGRGLAADGIWVAGPQGGRSRDGEGVIAMAEALAQTGVFSMLILDALSALISAQELAAAWGEPELAWRHRLWWLDALARLERAALQGGLTLLLLRQSPAPGAWWLEGQQTLAQIARERIALGPTPGVYCALPPKRV